MPKEMIYPPAGREGSITSDGPEPPVRVEIGWPAGDTSAPPPPAGRTVQVSVTQRLIADPVGARRLDPDDPTEYVPSPDLPGAWRPVWIGPEVRLDVPGIDQMIATLRRAQARISGPGGAAAHRVEPREEPLRFDGPLLACKADLHPMFCGRRVADNGAELGGSVYHYDYTAKSYDGLTPKQKAAMLDFLEAHGIGFGQFIEGSSLIVRVRCDGQLWLHAWRAVKAKMKPEYGEPQMDYLYCPHCPHCVLQERIVTPLVRPVPDFGEDLCMVAVGCPFVEVRA